MKLKSLMVAAVLSLGFAAAAAPPAKEIVLDKTVVALNLMHPASAKTFAPPAAASPHEALVGNKWLQDKVGKDEVNGAGAVLGKIDKAKMRGASEMLGGWNGGGNYFIEKTSWAGEIGLPGGALDYCCYYVGDKYRIAGLSDHGDQLRIYTTTIGAGNIGLAIGSGHARQKSFGGLSSA